MRLPRLALALLLPLLLVACVSTPERSRGAFVERSIDIDGKPHRYQVFVPATQAAGRSPAVLLFLHGSGERGSDGDKQTRVGIGPYLRAHMDDFPAIVVMPQAPDDTEWSDNLPLALGTLDAASREFHGDAARTYLLFALSGDEKTAEAYLKLFCEKSETQRQYVQKWIPIVAASQSVKGKPEERELLFRWVDVVDYE